MECKIDQTIGRRVPGAEYFHREGAYLLAIEDGMLAVAETPKGWFLPGGGIDPGESHEGCIRRECLEELGRDAQVDGYLGCAEAYIPHPDIPYFHPIYYFYKGKLIGAQSQPTEPDHVLRLVPVERAAKELYLEAQRWGLAAFLRETAPAALPGMDS